MEQSMSEGLIQLVEVFPDGPSWWIEVKGTYMRVNDEKGFKIRGSLPSSNFSLRHFNTFPTREGVSLPPSTSASISLVHGGSLKLSIRWFHAALEGDRIGNKFGYKRGERGMEKFRVHEPFPRHFRQLTKVSPIKSWMTKGSKRV